MNTSNRDMYIKKADTELNQLSTRLSILEAAARKAPEDADFDYDTRLSQFREHRDDIQHRLHTLEEGEVEDWDANQSELEKAMEKLGDELSQAMHAVGLTSESEKEKN